MAKYLFIDMDGTLLNSQKEITPGNRAAIDLALSRGHKIIITTGRPMTSALLLAHALGLDRPGCFLIAYNGAVIYDWSREQNIVSQTLPLKTVCKVFDHVNPIGLHIQTYDSVDVLVEPRCDNGAVRRYCSLIKMKHRVIGDVHTDLREEPVKCLVIDYEDQTELLKVRDWLRENMADEVDCFFSCDQYLEVVPKGMTKGFAVKALCEKLGVPIGDAIAVGDAANDLTMLQAAGIGVAMANGTDEVKAVADWVTTRDNDHDGVAEVIERFMP